MVKDIPKWMLLAGIAFAPWAFGCTRPWAIDALNILMAATLGAWGVTRIAIRSWAAIPLPLILAATYILIHGWGMTLNAPFGYDEASRTFTERTPLSASLPGSIDHERSVSIALRVSLLLGITCFVCQIGTSPVWRKRLIYTIALTGASVALFGLAQRLLDAPSIYWQARDTGNTFFAGYRYHSNAGSFLNLVWPFLAAILAISVRKLYHSERSKGLPWLPIIWSVGLMATFTALIISGARAASAIGLLVVGSWIIWWIRQTRKEQLPQFNPATAVIASVLGVMLLASIAATAGMNVSANRWNKTDELFSSDNPRLLVDEVCVTKMIPESGWFGFGPGTFRRAFPYFTNHLGDRISGVWLDAHQDYLQTIIEWGYLGAAALSVCILGGILNSYRKRKTDETRPKQTSFTDRVTHFALLTSAATILLHSQVDFPLQIASLQFYFAIILGLLWVRPNWQSLQPTRSAQPIH